MSKTLMATYQTLRHHIKDNRNIYILKNKNLIMSPGRHKITPIYLLLLYCTVLSG